MLSKVFKTSRSNVPRRMSSLTMAILLLLKFNRSIHQANVETQQDELVAARSSRKSSHMNRRPHSGGGWGEAGAGADPAAQESACQKRLVTQIFGKWRTDPTRDIVGWYFWLELGCTASRRAGDRAGQPDVLPRHPGLPEWNGSGFVSGLASEALVRIT